MRRRRNPAVLALLVAVACLGACSEAGSGGTRPSASTAAAASSPSTASPVPTPSRTQQTSSPRVIARGHGTGSGYLLVPHPARVGSMVTFRITCSGPGRVWVTDQTGHEILGTSGCQLGVVYGSGWHTTKRDGRRIWVEVRQSVYWVAELWLGTPPTLTSKTA